MEALTGALPSVIGKLGDLLVSEYNLQKGLKGEIRFLQAELETIKAALEDISKTPVDQLPNQDKIWARNVRELSYDIEDRVDTFMVQCKGSGRAEMHGITKFVDRTVDLFRQARIRRKIAMEIEDIKSCVKEVCERRDRYKVHNDVAKPVRVDPRLFARYEKVTKLVGIDEARDELVKILMEEGNEVSKQQDKIVSIVGFGGLGKTTLANVVYEKLKAQFDCSAFVSVSQTPDTDKLFKDMLYQLAKEKNTSVNVMNELREFLAEKRYFIIIDDIWSITDWKTIKCALPDNNVGYKIITTTRNLSIAEEVGYPYKLKPLSLHNSRKLLYGRIFVNESKDNNNETRECPDGELTEVSNKILEKCAGVPLAIITIASLLANKGRNKMDWYKVYNSIGNGLENSFDLDNMRKILSYSYYDMPSHLRTTLLYLSVFPEDFPIEKDRLIWMWIAEGFIQCEKQGTRLFELGESYFNELINRSMIQPVYSKYDGTIYSCRVHDMVLDLIRLLSSEENFVAISNDTNHASSSNTIRRLSLQNSKVDHATTQATTSMEQVRSVVVFPSAIDLMPALRSFRVLRVLDLEDCDLSQGYSLKYLGNLFQLRYLRLRKTRIAQLPEEVGNLRFLQTLDVQYNNISSLPSTLFQLSHLMCLGIDSDTRVPNGIGGLTSLEQLYTLPIDGSTDIIEELGNLTELRELHISLNNDWSDKLLECLRKLQKIQTLVIDGLGYEEGRNMGGLDGWVAPPHLRRLETRGACWFSTLPAWTSLLLDLSKLYIAIRELRQEDIEILGRLPALRFLELEVDHEDLRILGRFVTDAGSFKCLESCWLRGFVVPVMFRQGAMPRVTRLDFTFYVRETREIANSNGGFDLGLGNLPSLQEVVVYFVIGDASKKEVEEAKAALRHAAEIHPNHPALCIDSDDVYDGYWPDDTGDSDVWLTGDEISSYC